MNESQAFVGAVRGPVMMITIGLLLAADHLDAISFGRTWPIILIVLGLFKLAERMGAKTS